MKSLSQRFLEVLMRPITDDPRRPGAKGGKRSASSKRPKSDPSKPFGDGAGLPSEGPPPFKPPRAAPKIRLPPVPRYPARLAFNALHDRSWRLATAESCTGGMVAAAMTDIPGSSEIMDRGWVTYSDEAKMELLGVSAQLLGKYGAVSERVATAMALGALERSNADVALAVTGIAGPGGGSLEKPVGLVWFACSLRIGTTATIRQIFPGDRGAIRLAAMAFGLKVVETACRRPGIP